MPLISPQICMSTPQRDMRCNTDDEVIAPTLIAKLRELERRTFTTELAKICTFLGCQFILLHNIGDTIQFNLRDSGSLFCINHSAIFFPRWKLVFVFESLSC